jgi:hypothetical protein
VLQATQVWLALQIGRFGSWQSSPSQQLPVKHWPLQQRLPFSAVEHSPLLWQGPHTRLAVQIGFSAVGHWPLLQQTWQVPSAQRFGLSAGQPH